MIALLLLASQVNADEALIERLAGEYQHAGGEADQREVDDAIDRVVDEMMFLARDIARGRLRSSNQIPSKLRITRDEARILIGFDGRDRSAVLGAAPVKVVGTNGDDLRYTLRIQGDTLVQRFEGDQGGQINAIRALGDAIIVRVTVFSSRLPANLVYELRYARAGAGSSRAAPRVASRSRARRRRCRRLR